MILWQFKYKPFAPNFRSLDNRCIRYPSILISLLIYVVFNISSKGFYNLFIWQLFEVLWFYLVTFFYEEKINIWYVVLEKVSVKNSIIKITTIKNFKQSNLSFKYFDIFSTYEYL